MRLNPLPVLCILWILAFQTANSQIVECLQMGNLQGDSSYYDIFELKKGEFWIGGKSGVLKKFSLEDGLSDIPYPNQGSSILRINTMGNKVLLAADKGTLYSLENETWKIQTFRKYRKSCFYDLIVLDSLHAFLCGGKSKIAVGKRVIPHGFILATQDGGKSWKAQYKNASRMIWRLKSDSLRQEILALTYSPFGSQVLVTKDRGEHWKKSPWKDRNLYHDLDLSPRGEILLGGGKSGNLNNPNGQILKCVSLNQTKSSDSKASSLPGGLIWDYTGNEGWELATSCKGHVWVQDISDPSPWRLLTLPAPVNFYEAIFIDQHSALVIGSKKCLYKITLPLGETNPVKSVGLPVSGQMD